MSAVAEALVVGGGPAGAASAALLARAGKRVVLVERTAGPHDTVCGEFLSTEALHYLRLLGFDPFALGAVPIQRLRLSAKGRSSEAALPFPAASLSRRELDEALIGVARDAGVEVRRGAAVRELSMDDGAWCARLETGGEVLAEAAFIATGKHDLRGWRRQAGLHSDLIGFKMHFHCSPAALGALSAAVELVLFPGGYAGVEPVGSDRVNLCLLLRRRQYAALGRSWASVLGAVCAGSPATANVIGDARPSWARPLAVGAVPFGYLQSGASPAWHLGDQAAVVPSFTGTGIALALHSAFLSAEVFLAGGAASDYRRRLARDASRLVRQGTILSLPLVRPAAQAVVAAALRWMPGLLASSAAASRLPRVLRGGVDGFPCAQDARTAILNDPYKQAMRVPEHGGNRQRP